MAEKSYPFNRLSEKKCEICGRKLKKRLVEEKFPHNICLCYACGRIERGQIPRNKVKAAQNEESHGVQSTVRR